MEKISKLELLAFLALIVSFTYFGIKYFLSDSLQVYDAPGHLNLVWNIKENLWPAFWGWNASGLLGFDQGIYYPPLFHYLAAALSFPLGIEISVKLLIFAAILLLPVSVYYFSSKLFTDFKARLVTSCVLLLLIYIAPGYLGAGIKALTQIGLLTSFIATPLVFFYLGALLEIKKPNYFVQTLLLVVIILTHFVAGLFCLVLEAAYLSIKFLTGDFRWQHLQYPIFSLWLTSFFWLPLILRFHYTSVSIHPLSLTWPNLAAIGVSVFLTFSFLKAKKYNLLILSLVADLLILLFLGELFLSRFFGESFLYQKLYSLHLYRYQIYAYLLILVTVIYWPVRFLFSLKQPKINPIFIPTLTLGVLIFLLVTKPTLLVDQVKISVAGEESSSGRFIEVFSREDSYPFIYSAQEQLIRKKGQSWAYGLFTDSNENGTYLSSLIKTLSGTNSDGKSKFTVEDKQIDFTRIETVLNLFAVEQLLYLDSQQPQRYEGENFFTLPLGKKQFVEIPKQSLLAVSTDWDRSVTDWWLGSGKLEKLLVRTDKLPAKLLAQQHAQPQIINHAKDWSNFEIDTKSKKQVPLLVKFSYSPNWKATGQNGEELKIYTVSPNLMLVFASGKVRFVYQTLWYQKVTFIISVLTLIFLTFAVINRKNVFKV